MWSDAVIEKERIDELCNTTNGHKAGKPPANQPSKPCAAHLLIAISKPKASLIAISKHKASLIAISKHTASLIAISKHKASLIAISKHKAYLSIRSPQSMS